MPGCHVDPRRLHSLACLSLGVPAPEGHQIIPSCYSHNIVRPAGAVLLWMIVRGARHGAIGEMAWRIAASLKAFTILFKSFQLCHRPNYRSRSARQSSPFQGSRNNHLTHFLERDCHPRRAFFSVGKVQKMVLATVL